MKVERCRNRIRLQLQYIGMGHDACITLIGGDRPHLGAVAVAQVRESLAQSDKLSASVSNITLPGHKEDMLARAIAARLASTRAANVVVCCGIHLDGILPAEIEEILSLSNEMVDELLVQLQA